MPRTPWSVRSTTSSMNQESCSGVMPRAVAAKVWIDWPTMSMRWTIGSSMPRGRSARIFAIASLTSFSARSVGTSSRNSIEVSELPSVTVELMCLTPATPATASSTFRVTWVSSSEGAAPDWVMVTAITGTSMLGARVMGMSRKASTPSTVSTANSTMDGIGRRIAAPEMFSATV